MANIKKHLDNIKGALFGKDVRSSIHDGIDAINKEVESTTNRQEHLEDTFDQLVINSGNSNAEIVDARVGENGKSYAKLGDRLDEVDSQLEHIQNEYVFLSKFDNIGNGSDDTLTLQDIFDNANDNATVIFDNKKVYNIKSILITKNIKIDLNGCRINASPMVNKKALFCFRGSRDLLLSNVNLSENNVDIDLNVNEDCNIIIEDYTQRQGWDDGVKYSSPVIGRGELNTYLSKSEKVYRGFESDYINAKVYKINPLYVEVIGNGANICEIDLGEFTDNNTSDSPSLFHFDMCFNPKIENINVKGWNYKITSFTYCLNPLVSKISATNSFRSSIPAHGYLTQFVRCINAKTEFCVSVGARHLADYVNSFDCISMNNIAYDGDYAQYFAHGQHSKRIKSENDTCFNCKSGWGLGNIAFSQDFNMKVIRPTFINKTNDKCDVFIITSKSKGFYIEDCNVVCSGKVLYATAGCSDIEFNGGCIEGLNGLDTVVCRDVIAIDDTVNIKPSNLSLNKVRFKGNNKLDILIDGKLHITDIDFYNNDTTKDYAIVIQANSNIIDFVFADNRIKSLSVNGFRSFSNSINDGYVFSRNKIDCTNPIFLPAKNKMNWTFNNFTTNIYDFAFSTLTQIVKDTSIIDNNIPNTHDKTKDLEFGRYKVKSFTDNSTSIDITNFNYIVFGNTGGTTITSITTNAKEGDRLKMFSFNGNTTLSKGLNNFRLIGGGDVNIPANKFISFIYFNNQFVEDFRSF